MYVLESCDLYRSSLSPPPLIFNAMQRGDETAITPNDARMQQQQQRSSMPSFLFIVFMLFMLTNHSGDEYFARSQYQDTPTSPR